MNTIIRLLLLLLAGVAGFLAGHLLPVPGLRDLLVRPPTPAEAAPATPLSIDELVGRCDRRVRDLRLRVYWADQERLQLAIERRLCERAGDAAGAAQVQRIAAADARWAGHRDALQAELDELLALADRLRALHQAAPTAAAAEPDWLDEVRVRLKMAALDEPR